MSALFSDAGTPLLFQGQEFGASTRFLFFADHRPELAAAVQKGRAEFLSQFPSLASGEMQRELPPLHEAGTFERSILDWPMRHARAPPAAYEDLIAMRRGDCAFAEQHAGRVDGAVLAPEAFVLHYFFDRPAEERLLWINFGPDLIAGSFPEPLLPAGRIRGRCDGRAKTLSTAAPARPRCWEITGGRFADTPPSS